MSLARLALTGCLLLLLSPSSFAGSMLVRWSPAPGAASYSVYWGTASRQYTQKLTATTSTATLSGLTDATNYYVSVKSVDASGRESTAFSNEISGWARPTVTAVVPSRAAVGQRIVVTILGTNFGARSTLSFLNPGIVLHSKTYVSPTSMTADITVNGPSSTTPIGVEVVREEGAYGVGRGLFYMDAGSNPSAPSPASYRPVTGATGVPTSFEPFVRFTEVMSRSSITPATVRILDAAGTVVPQATGFPQLSDDGMIASLKPAVSLGYSTTYRLQVIGGASGVKDAGGMPMASTWTQAPGFTTAAPDRIAPQVSYASPIAGETSVPLLVQPTVRFSEPMLASSVTVTTVRLLDLNGSLVRQQAGSPVLSSDGMVATIKPVDPLVAQRKYGIRVEGVKDRAGNLLAGEWRQSTLWTTSSLPVGANEDLEGPIVSDVGTGPVDSTSLQLTWETDEPASSEVLYRAEGEEAYLETRLAGSLGRSHRVPVHGLLPGTRYEFQAHSADAAGNTSMSSPDLVVATGDAAHTYLPVEAESGALTGGLVVTQGLGASAGAWIELPAGSESGGTTITTDAHYALDVPSDGTWYVWLRVHRATPGAVRWYAAVDGSTWSPTLGGSSGGWTWLRVDVGRLLPGAHTLDLGVLDPTVRLDRIVVTDDPAFGGPADEPHRVARPRYGRKHADIERPLAR